MGKFTRSWALAKASMEVLRADKELLVFPLVSSLATLVVAASFLLPVFGLGLLKQADVNGGPTVALYLLLFAFYLVQYFVIFFFNTALVGAAMIRLDGGDPTVGAGLRIAAGKWTTILGYAAIAATVGMVLRALSERAGFLGRIVVSLLGVAWTVATYLTVPVLVARDVGPIEAVKESASLLGRTWGENLIGQGGIGVVFTLVYVAMGVVGAGLLVLLGMEKMLVPAIVVACLLIVAFILVALVQAALAGIYSAALYRFAVAGDAPAGFDGALLRNAFQRKA
ncbi:MAG TPA: DUF6159 family protein [Luteimonas sp.]|nr:DUF6159 family protein [Luteimonas sp.]